MEKDITLIKSALEGIILKIDRLDDKVNLLDNKVNLLDDKVNSLDNKVNLLDEKVNKLDEKFELKIADLRSTMMQGFTAFDQKTDLIYNDLREKIGTPA